MKSWFLAGALAAVGSLALPGESQAGLRIGILVGHDHGYRDTYRIAFGNGYQEGLRHGAEDGREDESFDFWHDRAYRTGDAGYRFDHGPRHEYVYGFRAGYERGYREGYWRNHDRSCRRHHGEDYGRRDNYRDRDYRYRDDDGVLYKRPRY